MGIVKTSLKTLPDELISLVVTSPPYNIGKEYETRSSIESYFSKQKEVLMSWCGGIKTGWDFVKDKLGVAVQFGKYVFMVCNVSAKMTIFHNLCYINAGTEIVPMKQLADQMSTGVSSFEQFVWDLENRGVADIDIPVLILGVDV